MRGPRRDTGRRGGAAPAARAGTDAPAAVTHVDGAVTIFAAIDHCTAECVGIHAATRGDRFEARGRVLRLGRGTAFAEGQFINEDGKVCAAAQGIWRVLWPRG